MKKAVLSMLCVLCILLFCTSCRGKTAGDVPPSLPAGTRVYTQRFLGEDAAVGNMLFARQLQGVMGDETGGLRQENVLMLQTDGRYRLDKTFSCEDEQTSFTLGYVFEGSYVRDGDDVVLQPPSGVTATVDWGTLADSFKGQSGVFTEKDSLAYPRAFNTPYLGDDNGCNEMYVQVDDTNGSFEITGSQSGRERYRTQELRAERGGLSIYGQVILPADYTQGRLPVVIFAHGFAGNHAAQQDVALMLAEYGFASYCFDFCGGALNGCRSDGSFYEMSMLTEKADLHAVVDMILRQDFTDTENVYLFGESMGGAVAALVAAERPEDIKGQMHFYPAFSISEQTRAAYESVEMIPERAPTAAGISVARVFYADALSIDIYAEIAPYKGPVLMFHGDLDTVVPIVYVRQSSEVLEEAELIVYTGEGHGFSRQAELRAAARMIVFLQTHTGQ